MSDSDPHLTSFRSVIELWASREAMAADVGARNWSVIKWWGRNTIPSKWWPAVLLTEKAKAGGVTLDILARLASRKVEEARA
jgi:hypothetical protein